MGTVAMVFVCWALSIVFALWVYVADCRIGVYRGYPRWQKIVGGLIVAAAAPFVAAWVLCVGCLYMGGFLRD